MFYAVHTGHQKGIVTRKEDMEPMISGYEGAHYRVFDNEEDARYFVEHGLNPTKDIPISKTLTDKTDQTEVLENGMSNEKVLNNGMIHSNSRISRDSRKSYMIPIYRYIEKPSGFAKIKKLEDFGFSVESFGKKGPLTDWQLDPGMIVAWCHGVTDGISKTGIGCHLTDERIMEMLGKDISISYEKMDPEAAMLTSIHHTMMLLKDKNINTTTLIHFTIQSEKLTSRLNRLDQFKKTNWMTKNNKPMKHHSLYNAISELVQNNYRFGHWGEYDFLPSVEEHKKQVTEMARNGVFK